MADRDDVLAAVLAIAAGIAIGAAIAKLKEIMDEWDDDDDWGE